MEQEVVVRKKWNTLKFYQRIQIGLMLFCFGCYVLANIYEVCSYLMTVPYQTLSGTCGPENREFSVDSTLINFKLSANAFWTAGDHEMACPCLGKTCVAKCCPEGQSFPSQENLICTKHKNLSLSDEISTNIKMCYKGTQFGGTEKLHIKVKEFNESDIFIFPDKSLCESGRKYKFPSSNYELNTLLVEDGTVLFLDLESITDLDRYCMELVDESIVVFTDCVNEYEDFYFKFFGVPWLYDTINIISSLLTLSTLLLYLLLSSLRNMHGKIVICLVMTLLGNYVTYFLHLTIMRDVGLLIDIFYIVTMSVNLWLTCMCYDIWSVFSKPLIVSGPPSDIRNLFTYCLVSWGTPGLLHIIRTWSIFTHHPNCSGDLYREDQCEQNQERSFYVAGTLPIYLLSALNLVMFFSTLVNLRLLGQQTAALRGPQSCRHARTAMDGLWVYAKLALVMCLPSALSTFLRNDDSETVSLGAMIGLLTSIFSPILLCVILTCNKRVLGALRDKVHAHQSTHFTS